MIVNNNDLLRSYIEEIKSIKLENNNEFLDALLMLDKHPINLESGNNILKFLRKNYKKSFC